MAYTSLILISLSFAQASNAGVIHEVFSQEVCTYYTWEDGLPDAAPNGERLVDVKTFINPRFGILYAVLCTENGNICFASFDGTSWGLVTDEEIDRYALDVRDYLRLGSGSMTLPDGGRSVAVSNLSASQKGFLAASAKKLYTKRESNDLQPIFETEETILSVAQGPDGTIAVGTANGLYLCGNKQRQFEKVYPADERYSWAPQSVSALAYDTEGRLWFGSKQGAGVYDGQSWRIFTGAEGLPYNHFTCATPGKDGAIWYGTERGAIRFDGKRWSYRASLRWLPDDRVNALTVLPDGTAWIATPGGISCIKRIDMTLESKAAYFIDQVETRHNRDGYVTDWSLTKRGDVSSAVPKITDNDGQYTANYGSAMCFRYALTGEPEAKQLAQRSFRACKRLVDIVPESMKGFPARVLIPIDWHEPVNEQYGDAYNRRKREDDPFWKLITPRFVTSEDGKYLWKNDTSSDELAGHYFFYALYYDLVAETEEEKEPVREVVRDITDHLIRNGFNLVDHDGQPTRWARFGPDFLNTVQGWEQRGLNSLMLLSYLATAEYITGDPKYGETAQVLRDRYFYHINAISARPFFPPDNVVPWDNIFVTMSCYALMNYEKDPELLIMYRLGLEHAWLFISRQKNPLWSLMYGAAAKRFSDLAEQGYFNTAFPDLVPYREQMLKDLVPYDPAVADTIDTLRDLPLELVGWPMQNSHRLDIELDPTPEQEDGYGWSRLDKKAIPINERSHVRQDRDGFKLDSSEDGGYAEHEGTFYLFPYYLGRYYGFLN